MHINRDVASSAPESKPAINRRTGLYTAAYQGLYFIGIQAHKNTLEATVTVIRCLFMVVLAAEMYLILKRATGLARVAQQA